MSAPDHPGNYVPLYKQLYTEGVHKQHVRLAGDMRALIAKKAAEVSEEPSPLLQELYDTLEKVANGGREPQEREWLKKDDPRYTGYFDKDVEPISIDEWSELQRERDGYRRVAWHEFETKDGETIKISTVWLGIDYSWGEGRPLIFESMIFGGKGNDRCDRYTTLNEAQFGHSQLVEWVRQHEELT